MGTQNHRDDLSATFPQTNKQNTVDILKTITEYVFTALTTRKYLVMWMAHVKKELLCVHVASSPLYFLFTSAWPSILNKQTHNRNIILNLSLSQTLMTHFSWMSEKCIVYCIIQDGASYLITIMDNLR